MTKPVLATASVGGSAGRQSVSLLINTKRMRNAWTEGRINDTPSSRLPFSWEGAAPIFETILDIFKNIEGRSGIRGWEWGLKACKFI